MKTGVLIINLGTPDDPSPKSVGRYLKQFLMDKWVIDVPWFFRWIMVHLLIVPKRKFKSSEAYKKVWFKEGSPLLVYSTQFASKVQKLLGSEYQVKLAMRYGNPSISKSIEEFRNENIQKLIVFSMYPQYAESSTRSSLDELNKALRASNYNPTLKIIPPFYQSSWFVKSYAQLISKKLQPGMHLLLTYHGLPERHIRKTDLTGQHCLQSENCCNKICDANRFCYRAHCFSTSRELAKELKLTKQDYSVSFQSRLGRTPWIKPYTDLHYKDLINEGHTNLLVVSPSFVTDCLETLEELGLRLREDFHADGGKKFELVACLNANDDWVQAVADVVVQFSKT